MIKFLPSLGESPIAVKNRRGSPRTPCDVERPFGELFARRFNLTLREDLDEVAVVNSIFKLLGINPNGEGNAERLCREVFEYRLKKDTFSRHSFRNVLLDALEEVAKNLKFDIETAFEAMRLLYRLPPECRIIPVTRKRSTLNGLTQSGKKIAGQCWIDFSFRDPSKLDPYDRLVDLWLQRHGHLRGREGLSR